MTSNHHTPLPPNSASGKPLMTGDLFNAPLGELDSAITDILAGTTGFTQLKYGDGGELTIATGAITVTNSYHNIDTQSDAASDNLDTVNGMAVGDHCYIRANDTARDVVITDSVGNVKTVTSASITLDDTEKMALLFHNGTDIIAMELGAALASSAAFTGVRVERSTTLSLATGSTGTEITYTQEAYDTDAFFAPSSTDVIIPSGFTGKYRVTASVEFPSNATGFRKVEILVAGARKGGDNRNTISGEAVIITTDYEGELTAAQAVSCRAAQTSGGNLTLPAAGVWMTVEKLD